MGNSQGRRSTHDESRLPTLPTGLYGSCEWDQKIVTRLIVQKKLAARCKGSEDESLNSKECPICFLNYPTANKTKCCNGDICTECYLQVKSPKSASECPFCKTLGFEAIYLDKMTESSPIAPVATSPITIPPSQSSTPSQHLSTSPVNTMSTPSSAGSPTMMTPESRQLLESEMKRQRDDCITSESYNSSAYNRSRSGSSGGTTRSSGASSTSYTSDRDAPRRLTYGGDRRRGNMGRHLGESSSELWAEGFMGQGMHHPASRYRSSTGSRPEGPPRGRHGHLREEWDNANGSRGTRRRERERERPSSVATAADGSGDDMNALEEFMLMEAIRLSMQEAEEAKAKADDEKQTPAAISPPPGLPQLPLSASSNAPQRPVAVGAPPSEEEGLSSVDNSSEKSDGEERVGEMGFDIDLDTADDDLLLSYALSLSRMQDQQPVSASSPTPTFIATSSESSVAVARAMTQPSEEEQDEEEGGKCSDEVSSGEGENQPIEQGVDLEEISFQEEEEEGKLQTEDLKPCGSTQKSEGEETVTSSITIHTPSPSTRALEKKSSSASVSSESSSSDLSPSAARLLEMIDAALDSPVGEYRGHAKRCGSDDDKHEEDMEALESPDPPRSPSPSTPPHNADANEADKAVMDITVADRKSGEESMQMRMSGNQTLVSDTQSDLTESHAKAS